MKGLTCLAMAMVALIGSANGVEGTTRLTVAPRSTLFLRGSSNIADWRCSGSTLSGLMEVAAPLVKINQVIDRIEDGNVAAWLADPEEGHFPQPRFDLSVPIKTLRCSGGRPMERDVVGALKATRYPEIRFRFIELRGSVEHDIDRHLYHAIVAGEVSLAGTTRAIEIIISAERMAHDRFHITAALPLRMTDFGIVPPRAFFGMLRAEDQLTVEFNLELEADPHA